MSIKELDNLVQYGHLKQEPPIRDEYLGMLKIARQRLAAARKKDLPPEIQFDLAYDAAHSFALAALRREGYRPNNARFIAFQTLEHTLKIKPAVWRVLSDCHNKRNKVDYEGIVEVDEQLLAELIQHTTTLEKIMSTLPPPPG
jgi:hypothetical protein